MHDSELSCQFVAEVRGVDTRQIMKKYIIMDSSNSNNKDNRLTSESLPKTVKNQINFDTIKSSGSSSSLNTISVPSNAVSSSNCDPAAEIKILVSAVEPENAGEDLLPNESQESMESHMKDFCLSNASQDSSENPTSKILYNSYVDIGPEINVKQTNNSISYEIEQDDKSKPTPTSLPAFPGNGMFNMFVNIDEEKAVKNVPSKFLERIYKPTVIKKNEQSISLIERPLVKLSDLDKVSPKLDSPLVSKNLSRYGLVTRSENTLNNLRLSSEIYLMPDFLMKGMHDVILLVEHLTVNAHRKMLIARSPYFSRVFSNRIVTETLVGGYSPSATLFVLNFIYKGHSGPLPQHLCIKELAGLADLFVLEGLRFLIVDTVVEEYLHNFHEPCETCTLNTLIWFENALNYKMDDLHYSCTNRIINYFDTMWAIKKFCTLPKPLINRCLMAKIVDLNPSNTIDTMIRCYDLLESIRSRKWATPAIKITHTLLSECTKFVSSNLCKVITVNNLNKLSSSLQKDRLIRIRDYNLLIGVEGASPVQTSRLYTYLNQLPDSETSQSAELLPFIKTSCESVLVKNINVISTPKVWGSLTDAERVKIESLVEYVKTHPLKSEQKRGVTPNMLAKLELNHIKTMIKSCPDIHSNNTIVPVRRSRKIEPSTRSRIPKPIVPSTPIEKRESSASAARHTPLQYKDVPSRYLKPVNNRNNSASKLQKPALIKPYTANSTYKPRCVSQDRFPSRILTTPKVMNSSYSTDKKPTVHQKSAVFKKLASENKTWENRKAFEIKSPPVVKRSANLREPKTLEMRKSSPASLKNSPLQKPQVQSANVCKNYAKATASSRLGIRNPSKSTQTRQN